MSKETITVNDEEVVIDIDLDGGWRLISDLPEGVTEGDVENAVENWKFWLEKERDYDI